MTSNTGSTSPWADRPLTLNRSTDREVELGPNNVARVGSVTDGAGANREDLDNNVMENDTPTLRKLREAEFFLAKLKEIEASTRLDRVDFDFYLSAFLSASRSVTFVLQAEDKAAYDAWFPTWRQERSEADRELLAFMNEQRVEVVHRKGTPELERVIELVEEPMSSGANASRYQYAARFSYMAMGFERARVGVARHYFQIGDRRVSVVEICLAGILLMRELVQDFYA